MFKNKIKGAHSFFFTGVGCYLLLFDISIDIEKIISENRLVYWFHFLQISLKNERCPVLLIGTKFDEFLKKNVTENSSKVDMNKVNEKLREINKGIKKFFLSKSEILTFFL